MGFLAWIMRGVWVLCVWEVFRADKVTYGSWWADPARIVV